MSTLKALLAQKAELDKTIADARKSETAQALATVRGLVEEFGLSQGEVFPSRRAKRVGARKEVAPKYRDPATGATWTGRGKAPVWIRDKDRAQFAI